MDLLGSILNSMEKPPTTKINKEEQEAKKQQERLKKIQDQEKALLRKFKDDIQAKVNKLFEDDTQTKYQFEPMDKVHRAIVHEIADVAGLTAHSFGIEDVDRHIIIYKKEAVPSEDELAALRRGEEYDPVKAKLMKELEKEEASKKKQKIEPASNYRDKYEHLIGKEAGKRAAQKTTSNQQFGLVPSANKRDLRSIEQIMEDNKKKKQKVSNEQVNHESSSLDN